MRQRNTSAFDAGNAALDCRRVKVCRKRQDGEKKSNKNSAHKNPLVQKQYMGRLYFMKIKNLSFSRDN
jgi:hypothetical protein